MKITKEQARRFIIAHQELLAPRSLDGKEGIIKYINKVGCIQFDPLDMVGMNPSLVCQSRIKKYNPKLLNELLYTDRKLLDGWDKNMSIYPVEDYPYFSRYRKKAYERYSNHSSSINDILEEVREVIRKKGPVSSIDLDFDTTVDWAWAPTRVARAALESMYFWGELVIENKIGTRKLYDFTEKYVPKEVFLMEEPNTTIEEYHQWHIKRRIRAIGLLWDRGSDAWLGIYNMKSNDRSKAMLALKEKGEIIPIEVEDIKYTFYLAKEDLALLEEVIKGITIEPQVAFIGALDNLIWDRKLIKEIFGFEYIWEVYKPIEERKYGYYVLPVIYGDRFVARFEPRFHKKTKKLEIINWWWEPNITLTKELKKALNQCFEEFKKHLGATSIDINEELKGSLKLNAKTIGK